MKKAMFAVMMFVALMPGLTALYATDLLVLSDESVKCAFTHPDRWKGKISGEGILLIGMYGENEKIYIAWGKDRDNLLQKNEFLLKKEIEPSNKKPETPVIPYYQEFTDMLKKSVEWDKAADENGLEDVQKLIALGWAYHKLKQGTPGWISKTWGSDGNYELIEIKMSEIPKLLNLFEGVPDLEKKLQGVRKKIQEDADSRKAEEKAKKDKVDSLLK